MIVLVISKSRLQACLGMVYSVMSYYAHIIMRLNVKIPSQLSTGHLVLNLTLPGTLFR